MNICSFYLINKSSYSKRMLIILNMPYFKPFLNIFGVELRHADEN